MSVLKSNYVCSSWLILLQDNFLDYGVNGDPTRVNEADVVRGPNCDFAVKVFYRNHE